MIASKDLIGRKSRNRESQFHIVYVCVCLYTFLKFASRLFKNGLKLLFCDLKVGDWFKYDFGDNYGEFQEIFARK